MAKNELYVSEIKVDGGRRKLLWDSEEEAEGVCRRARIAILELKMPVHIFGETGTGKSLVARMIHQNLNGSSTKPFMTVNCSSIAANLEESELFGHEKGAFTGADERRIGKFEAAGNGTLFLDEIGDLPPHTQTKLLIALEDRHITRVGGHELVPVMANIISATHANLQELVKQNRFRADLLFRVDQEHIELKPLRERSEAYRDATVSGMVNDLGQDVTIADDAKYLLMNLPLPGNLRELHTLVRRAYINARVTQTSEPMITLENVQMVLPKQQKGDALPLSSTMKIFTFKEHTVRSFRMADGMRCEMPMGIAQEDREAMEILAALLITNNNRTRAAALLHIAVRTIQRRIEKYDLDPEFDRIQREQEAA